MSSHSTTADTPIPDEVSTTLGLDASGRFKRILRRVLALLAVVALALLVWRQVQQWRTPPPVTIETTAVVMTDLAEEVVAVGTLEPREVVNVGSELSGRVVDVAVDVDEMVEAGQVLILFDTERLDSEVAQARAQLSVARAGRSQARVTRDEAETSLERVERLERRGLATEEELDRTRAVLERSEAALDVAEAQVRAAHAVVDMAETALATATVHAPIDGIILSRSVDPGQVVAATFQAPQLFEIAANLDEMQVSVAIDEAEVGRVEPGMPARFTVPAYPERVFDAELVAVRQAPQLTNGVVTYEAILDVDNADGALRPGMTVTARITTALHEQVLAVPLRALRLDPPEHLVEPETEIPVDDHVWLQRGEFLVPVSVVRGAESTTHAEVRGALEEGASIVTDTTTED